jgi:hypothetical protein
VSERVSYISTSARSSSSSASSFDKFIHAPPKITTSKTTTTARSSSSRGITTTTPHAPAPVASVSLLPANPRRQLSMASHEGVAEGAKPKILLLGEIE